MSERDGETEVGVGGGWGVWGDQGTRGAGMNFPQRSLGGKRNLIVE